MKDYYTTVLLTANINIKPQQLKGDINKLILKNIKEKYEGKCNKDGYILKDSIKLIQRSIGEVKTINSNSIINYNITYSADIITPSEGDIYECYIETINKLGIIAYIKISEEYTIKESPFIIIIPKEYIDEKQFDIVKPNEKINMKISSFRVKYNSNHIQIVATLV